MMTPDSALQLHFQLNCDPRTELDQKQLTQWPQKHQQPSSEHSARIVSNRMESNGIAPVGQTLRGYRWMLLLFEKT